MLEILFPSKASNETFSHNIWQWNRGKGKVGSFLFQRHLSLLSLTITHFTFDNVPLNLFSSFFSLTKFCPICHIYCLIYFSPPILPAPPLSTYVFKILVSCLWLTPFLILFYFSSRLNLIMTHTTTFLPSPIESGRILFSPSKIFDTLSGTYSNTLMPTTTVSIHGSIDQVASPRILHLGWLLLLIACQMVFSLYIVNVQSCFDDHRLLISFAKV